MPAPLQNAKIIRHELLLVAEFCRPKNCRFFTGRRSFTTACSRRDKTL